MKKLSTLLTLAVLAVAARATTFTFQPGDADLADLDHHYAYTWGITNTLSGTGTTYSTLKAELASGYTITSATLTFTNIWDWVVEPNDRLWMHLLDNPRKNVRTVQDNPNDIETPTNDYFSGQGLLLDTPNSPGGFWTDPFGGVPSTFDLVINFDLIQRNTLKDFINNGGYTSPSTGYADFGFGFDADCHYYNDGIRFVVHTAPAVVPEGGMTLVLLALGLIGFMPIRRFLVS